MSSGSSLLQLEHVSRRLSGRQVIDDVTFGVARGEVLGLLGVNGAGKSTTLAMIAGVLAPDAGTVKLDGRDLHELSASARARVGYLPENVPLWPELTVREYLDACGRLRGLDRASRKRGIDRELLRLDLSGLANRLSGQLSLGQKRRLGLAQALLHDPELLVLDEPGNGLDPVQTTQLRELIRTLSESRATIISTHVLSEVEAMCDRVVILHEGQVRFDAPLAQDRGALDRAFLAIARGKVAAAA
ncbi:MAG TPA: ABC transporter ATP-binding protein [Rhodanobacteraceae bacterium]